MDIKESEVIESAIVELLILIEENERTKLRNMLATIYQS